MSEPDISITDADRERMAAFGESDAISRRRILRGETPGTTDDSDTPATDALAEYLRDQLDVGDYLIRKARDLADETGQLPRTVGRELATLRERDGEFGVLKIETRPAEWRIERRDEEEDHQ